MWPSKYHIGRNSSTVLRFVGSAVVAIDTKLELGDLGKGCVEFGVDGSKLIREAGIG